MSNVYLTDFKTYLEFTLDDVDHDSLLDMLLGASQGFISSLYNVYTFGTTESLTLNGNGKSYMYLSFTPITGVTVLTIDGEAIDVSEYYFVDNAIHLMDGAIFSRGNMNVTMDVAYGYTIDTVPDDLKFALFKIAEKTYYDATQNREGVSTLSNDIKQRASFYNEIPEIAEIILSTYKKFNLK